MSTTALNALASGTRRASNATIIRRLLSYMKPFNGVMFASLSTRVVKIVSQAALLGIAAASVGITYGPLGMTAIRDWGPCSASAISTASSTVGAESTNRPDKVSRDSPSVT